LTESLSSVSKIKRQSQAAAKLTTTILNPNELGYIKEPKGVDFVVEPIPLTPEDRQMISNAIALYKATGKITRAPRPKRKARRATKKVKK
jgi:hypothetical protein